MSTSIADLPPEYQRQVREKFAAEDARRAAPIAEPPKPKRKSKYGNTRTPYKSVQGFERVYDSKAEVEYALLLDRAVAMRMAKWWLPQVAVPLPGGVTYRADFLVQWADRLAFVDVKGKDTQASINKRKQVKACFGIEVEVVRK